MKIQRIKFQGMETDQWTHKSCTAEFGLGADWATLYLIESKEEGKGHATELLREAKKFYNKKGKKFGGSVALNDTMKHIYKKLKIKEYS